MSPNRIRRIVNASLWLAALISASVFLAAAVTKLSGSLNYQFEAWGYDGRLALVVGLLELFGAVGLLLPRTAGWAALGLSGLMIGAIGTHVTHGDPIAALLPAGMLGLLALVLWGRGLVMEPTTRGHVVATKNP
jgi:putative oxidoreductase